MTAIATMIHRSLIGDQCSHPRCGCRRPGDLPRGGQHLDGQEAPNFDVEKWFNPAEGSTIEDLRGKAILLEFWATS